MRSQRAQRCSRTQALTALRFTQSTRAICSTSSPLKYVNKRTDEYGGSFENRYRFAVEVVQAIKKACGDDFPVSPALQHTSKTKGFRQVLSPGEAYTEVGRDMAESEKAVQVSSGCRL